MFAANCTEWKQNQGETDVDCGESCLECETCYDGVKIKVKMILTAEDHVLRAQLVMMEFRTREKYILTAEDHVLLAQLVTMVFRIKEKPPLIAEAHVPNAMV